MKGVKFYLEYPERKDKIKATRKALGNHCGAVVAVFSDTGRFDIQRGRSYLYDCLSAVCSFRNSMVAGGSVSIEYLADSCKLISEKLAREIHPALFERLD